MSNEIPQELALTVFLAAVAGNEPHSSLIETRWREGPGQAMSAEFMFCRAARAISERVAALAGRGDIYIGAAPRTRSRGTAADIERCWVLWVDLDVDDAVQRLEAFEPRPSIVLLTGTGGRAQALWALHEPLTGPHLDEHAKRANKRLAHALGGDMASTDLARILRAPTTSNHKHDPPVATRCVRLELAVFTARQVVGHLPDPPAPVSTLRPPSARQNTTDDPLLSIPADEYVPALTGRPMIGLYVQCPFHEGRRGGPEQTPSLRVYDTTWACYGCDPQPGAGRDHLGGSIYTLAALLGGYPLPLRGDDFLRVRDVLTRHFSRAAAA